jgi:CheY-like chemotaxis protein
MKILIAEDELGIAETYQVLLEGRGHDVKVTHDGSECLKAYHAAIELLDNTSEDYLSKNPPFDVVVLDYFMPNMDGMQAAKLILTANKHQRIIFASAYVKSTLEESVQQLHAVVELLEKPFDLELLVNIIEDKRVYEELKKINAKVKQVKDPQIEELKGLLQGLKKTQTKTPLLS